MPSYRNVVGRKSRNPDGQAEKCSHFKKALNIEENLTNGKTQARN